MTQARRPSIVRRIVASKITLTIVIVIAAPLLFAAGFHAVCRTEADPAQPRASILTQEERRPQESTYLTFPEWWLVYSSQEYGRSLEWAPPSAFPYWRSIGQFWSGYCSIDGMAHGPYAYNGANHLMIMVIGVSTTVEYALKGVYEGTIGRVSELTARDTRRIGGIDTDEDRYAQMVAEEYGAFIPYRPWYEYPFGSRLAGLWSETGFWGPHPIRSWERKLFLSAEYGAKGAYAWVIGLATHGVYGATPDTVYGVVTDPTAGGVSQARIVRDAGDGAAVVALPHYQPFTDTVPGMLRQGMRIRDLGGNGEIMLSVIAPQGWAWTGAGREVFRQSILTDPARERIAIVADVATLHETLAHVEAGEGMLEHLYDY